MLILNYYFRFFFFLHKLGNILKGRNYITRVKNKEQNILKEQKQTKETTNQNQQKYITLQTYIHTGPSYLG